ncbi:MAG: ABC transporter permease [Planctomycetes bacterium]|nr:ABC transporter permease [Planctomycetota bacterium]
MYNSIGKNPIALLKLIYQRNNFAAISLGILCVFSLLAIFAPFIANHRPYVLVRQNSIEFPLFNMLRLSDWILFIGFFLGLLTFWFCRSMQRKAKCSKRATLYIYLGAVLLTFTASLLITLDRPTLDTTDYYALSQSRDNWAIFAPLVHDPVTANIAERLKEPGWQGDLSTTNWLGTDGAGADVCTRLIHASRIALSIGLISTSIALLLGVCVGSVMGYFGAWIDTLGMRIIEIFMAIPRLFLLLLVMAFIPPQFSSYTIYAMMIVIGLTSWMNCARFVRAEFLKLRELDYICAAKAVGLPRRSIIFYHLLPNGITPVLVDASFSIAAAILLETSLSFLGFGIKPPDPSWGQMLAEAIDPSTGVFHWWLAFFPGVMIFLTVFSLNCIGDALRDVLDSRFGDAAR